MDDREIVNYNTDSGRYHPRVQWIEKVEPEHWKAHTQLCKQEEAVYTQDVKIVMSSFNQTGGFHFYQVMFGCELGDDGSISGFEQHGYDGKEFMSLDTQTWTYIPTVSQAQISAQKLNSPKERVGERHKNYLENICIYRLKKYMKDGREDLERRVQPEVKVSGQEKDETLTLHCQVYGFHPKQVDVKWMKNGKDDVPTYQTTHTLPNPDGTYQIRVTAEVIPKEGDSYSCYVDHSSLPEPMKIVWEPKSLNVRVILITAAGVIALLAGGVGGFLLYKKKKDGGYKTTGTSDTSSDSSNNPAKA
ncbi:class I histocompatibility antigen, F10 alpha chain-like isoform 2-T3 [Leptodactylus fuscus]